jgi:hypothetical protein
MSANASNTTSPSNTMPGSTRSTIDDSRGELRQDELALDVRVVERVDVDRQPRGVWRPSTPASLSTRLAGAMPIRAATLGSEATGSVG